MAAPAAQPLTVEAIMQRGGLLHKLSVVDDKGQANLLGTFLDDGLGPASKTILNHVLCKNEYEKDLAAVRRWEHFTLVAYSKEKDYRRVQDFVAYLRARGKAAKVVLTNVGTVGFLFPDQPATEQGVPCIQCYYDTGKPEAPQSPPGAGAGSRKRPAPTGTADGGPASPTAAAAAAAAAAKKRARAAAGGSGGPRFYYIPATPLKDKGPQQAADDGHSGDGGAGPVYKRAGDGSTEGGDAATAPPPALPEPSQFPRSREPRFRYVPPTPLPGQVPPPFYDDPESCPAFDGGGAPAGELAALLIEAEAGEFVGLGGAGGGGIRRGPASAAPSDAGPAAATAGAWGRDQQVAAGFYNTLRREKGTRNQSLIFHLRKLNNWVKAQLINGLRPAEPTGREIEVLDLACGKGGDFTKWRDLTRRFPVARYVGVDIAKASLVDAIGRYHGDKGIRASLGSALTLGCADLGATDLCNDDIDVWEATEDAWGTRPLLDEGDQFDAITMQFALHYMFEDEARARRFFQSVARHLRPGGQFIATTVDARVVVELLAGLGQEDPATGACVASLVDDERRELCRLQVDKETYARLFRRPRSGSSEEEQEEEEDSFCGLRYSFLLRDGSEEEAADAVNAPEWLIPLPRLVDMAAECGLQLETAQNFHEFVHAHRDRLDGQQRGIRWLNCQGSISPTEWDIARIYIALRFRRV